MFVLYPVVLLLLTELIIIARIFKSFQREYIKDFFYKYLFLSFNFILYQQLLVTMTRKTDIRSYLVLNVKKIIKITILHLR